MEHEMRKEINKFKEFLNENSEEKLNISDVIHRISWVYFVGKRNKATGVRDTSDEPKMFLDEELSKKYWEEMGKEEYTWWRGEIYGV